MNTGYHGIAVDQINYFTVINNTFIDSGRYGIETVHGTKYGYIYNNEVRDSGRSGIRLSDKPNSVTGSTYDSKDIIVFKNNVYNSEYSGIFMDVVKNIYVYNNTVYHNNNNEFCYGFLDAENCIVENNTCYGRNFIEWTNEYGVLYIFYRNRRIEIWGENEENIHKLIHFLINKIKTINQKRLEKEASVVEV